MESNYKMYRIPSSVFSLINETLLDKNKSKCIFSYDDLFISNNFDNIEFDFVDLWLEKNNKLHNIYFDPFVSKEYFNKYDVVMDFSLRIGRVPEENIDVEIYGNEQLELALQISLMINLLKDGGKCVFLAPAGILFNRKLVNIRKKLLLNNRIEKIHILNDILHPYTGCQMVLIEFIKEKNDNYIVQYLIYEDRNISRMIYKNMFINVADIDTKFFDLYPKK